MIMNVERNRNFTSLLLKIFFLVLIILTFVSCRQKNNPNQQSQGKLNVDAYLAEYENFSVAIQSTGDLLPYEEVEIKTPVSGNVVKINFNEGQLVQKGFLLVEIDSRIWAAQKRGLEARLKTTENEYARKTELFKIDGISLEEVERSSAEVDDLKAKINELDVMIDLAHIRAPFGGRLGMRNFSPGAYLSQGQIVTRLVQSDQLKVNFTIPSRYSHMAVIHQKVKVIPSGSGDTALAVIYAVDPLISQTSRTLQVRALIDNKASKLIPGDFVQIILKVDIQDDAILIPAEAIIPEQNTQVVFVVRNGKALKVKVETGTRTSDRVLIIEGLNHGDTVITTGLMGVKDGEHVEIRNLVRGVVR
jgi:membrane fusion protein, multidrug efflux system